MSSKQIAALKSSIQKTYIVPYLTPEEVYRIVAKEGIKGDRNSLLIKTLFETGLRISEALSITPRMIGEHEGHAILYVKCKRKTPRMVSCPDGYGLAHQLKSHAYTKKLEMDERIFRINRKRAWQIIRESAVKTGIQKRVYPHLFRHSDAIERLRQTGNPKALQYHLGHNSIMMTMRYLATLTAEDALRIQQEVRFQD